MKPCPTCGVMLAASLADAVKNLSRPESCPRAVVEPAPEPSSDPAADPMTRLAALMLLGRLFEEARS